MVAVAKAGWKSSGSSSYFDKDENITRSVDIHAYLCRNKFEAKDIKVGLEYHLLIEVKKSEQPWVVFIKNDERYEKDAWSNPHLSVNLDELSVLNPILAEYSIRRKLGWMARGLHESFKDPKLAGRWYAAAVTACKTTTGFFENEWVDLAKKNRGRNLYMTHPVVVIDGAPLIAAKSSIDGDTLLEEIPYAPFAFEFGTAKYKKRTYRVDLVTLGALPEFLDICRNKMELIYDELEDEASGA